MISKEEKKCILAGLFVNILLLGVLVPETNSIASKHSAITSTTGFPMIDL